MNSMRSILINLKRASKRRERMAAEFASVGLQYEIWKAIDGQALTQENLSYVDWEGRRRLGLYPQALGSIACWLTYREVMQDLVKNGPEVIAIFQDDARFDTGLPNVLNALDEKKFPYDVVVLHRRNMRRTFVPCVSLTDKHVAGRVKYADYGSESYVITQAAANHFLQITEKMTHEIDHALPYYWESGLNVYYVRPPVVFHAGIFDSQIEQDRMASRRQRHAMDNPALVAYRRLRAMPSRILKQRRAFRELMQGRIGVTRWEN